MDGHQTIYNNRKIRKAMKKTVKENLSNPNSKFRKDAIKAWKEYIKRNDEKPAKQTK